MRAWFALVVVGCARNGAGPVSLAPARVESARAIDPAGTIANGRFHDVRDGWEVVIPEGWVARPAPADGPLRVIVDQVGTGTQVEIWTYAGTDPTPRRRDRCAWMYRDVGHFSAVPLHDGIVHVATCVPDEPRDDRIFAYIVVVDGRTFQLEVHVPTTALVSGKAAGDALIQGLVW